MEIREAFQIVNKYIKENHPFSSKNDRWDRKHGKKEFIYGFRHLEEYIECIAEGDYDESRLNKIPE